MPFDARLLSGVSILSAVVEAGSFVRAAELLNMTPSGVSHGVARLEARVGARLFNRTTRALHLTDEGRRLYERVSPLLGEIEEAANEASGATEVVRGRLRVNVDPFFSRLVLAAHLAAFLQNHPQLRLELVASDAIGDLVAEGFDLAVRFGDPPPEDHPPPQPVLQALRHWARTGTSPWAAGFDAIHHGDSIPEAIKAAGGDGWFPYAADATAEAIAQAHDLGLQVGAWSINDPAQMRALVTHGIDAICTDRPDLML